MANPRTSIVLHSGSGMTLFLPEGEKKMDRPVGVSAKGSVRISTNRRTETCRQASLENQVFQH
jgi:hypothetical protein